jgi:hypothetical protein
MVYGVDNEGRTVDEVAARFREHLIAPAGGGASCPMIRSRR